MMIGGRLHDDRCYVADLERSDDDVRVRPEALSALVRVDACARAGKGHEE